MKLDLALKKLQQAGYEINSRKSLYNTRYIATKTGKQIIFTFEDNHICDIYYMSPSGKSCRVGNITTALQESGDVIRKKLKSDELNVLRKRVLLRWVRNLSLTDDELLSLKLHSFDHVQNAMTTAFPVMSKITSRQTEAGRMRRNNLEKKTNELWDRLKDLHVKKYPTQPPLRCVYVSSPVATPEGFKPSYTYSSLTEVRGDMPVFAWSPMEAIASVKMLFGDFVTARDGGIAAIGTKEEAMAAFTFTNSPSVALKSEITRIEEDIELLLKKLAYGRQALEYAKKKLEVASFIDGVKNMTTMIDA